MKRLKQAIETELNYEVNEMIVEAGNPLTGHSKQCTRPMLMLRVEYSNESQPLNSFRFASIFMESVSSTGGCLLFNRRVAERKLKKDANNELEEDEGYGGKKETKEGDDYIGFNKEISPFNKVKRYSGTNANVSGPSIDKEEKSSLRLTVEN